MAFRTGKSRLLRILIWVAGGLLLAVLLLAGWLAWMILGGGSSPILARVEAPGGQVDAVLTMREGGATVPTATAIYLIPHGGRNSYSPFLLADHVEGLRLVWQDKNHLTVRAASARIFQQKSSEILSGQVEPIMIRYDIKPENVVGMAPAPWDEFLRESKYEHFSELNFGATGTAAGYSPWILHHWSALDRWRIGTTRPQWGSPFGSPPYGDDPVTQLEIDGGINYAHQHGH